MRRLREEYRAAWSALLYFTRLPLPCPTPYDPEDLRRAAAYWPLTGWLVGAVAGLLYTGLGRLMPLSISSGLALVATLLLTGAMHEDGLADVCDGLGGGTTRERSLEIMKDSTVGAFGAAALVLSLGLRWKCIEGVNTTWALPVLVAAFASTRALAISLMAFLDYVRVGPSKARPLAQRLSFPRLSLALGLGGLPLLWVPQLWPCLLVSLAGVVMLGLWFRRRLGGYTGDCLGAAQQVGEILFLVTALSLP